MCLRATPACNVLTRVRALLPNPELTADSEPTASQVIQSALSGRVASLVHNHLGQTAYLRNVKAQMHELMETDTFYEGVNQASPEAFWARLDEDPDLLGFPNGVLNMKDALHGGGAHFYDRASDGGVPAGYAVSLCVPFEYKGSADGSPLTAEQRREMEEVQAKFKRLFPAAPMWAAARLVFGSVMYGGNSTTKAVFQLLGPTNGGKSWVYKFVLAALGPAYVAAFNKQLIVQTKRVAEDNGPTHQLYRIYRMRAVFSSETSADDQPNDALKSWVGGDMGVLRPMYKEQFTAPVLPKFFLPSNFPLKHDSTDGAWACPIEGRLRTALSMDAKFVRANVEDDPEKGVFKADDGNELQKFYDQRRHGCLLLLLQFAREFAAAGFKLPLTPESVAKARIQDAGTCEDFMQFVKDNYESTKNEAGQGDYAKFGRETAMKFTHILGHYNQENPDCKITKDQAKEALNMMGNGPKSIINDANDINLNKNGVFLRQK